ncbi:MAG: hypothetical protein FWF02_05965 [Micrococcales bacterium]|nr:hypothetical protein [Micrococcales bacterium]MCL2667237.1 hypothetical protein [Micrococcales bacterium]
MDLLQRAFVWAQALEDCGGDEARVFWVELDRGTFEEFAGDGDLDDDDLAELRADWEHYCPDPTGWFQISLTRHRGSVALGINSCTVAYTAADEPSGAADPRLRAVAEWVLSVTQDVVEQVDANWYNGYVAANLPHRKRVGRIRRVDWWDIHPDERERHLRDFSADEADHLVQAVKRRQHVWRERLPSMTLVQYLKACRIAYVAARAEGAGDHTARELYTRHADGRHDGLLNLAPESAEEFAEFRQYDGRPWQILAGANDTGVSLYPTCDDDGWYLTVASDTVSRSVEAARIYLALIDHAIPVALANPALVVNMLTGADDIGIVPEDVRPTAGCQTMFLGGNVADFRHLVPGTTAETVSRAYWYPIPLVRPAPHQ